MNKTALRTDNKTKGLRHVVVFALILVAWALAAKLNLRLPEAEWAGPAIVTILFGYGVWIRLRFGPMRNL